MDTENTPPCRKRKGRGVSFGFKLSVIDEINNGLISTNHASKVYNISRSTIDYWRKKLSTSASKSTSMSKDQELKKLKERIEALEFIKGFQQDLIAEFAKETGQELSKKRLPEHWANEIRRKKKKLSKGSGCMKCSGSANRRITSGCKHSSARKRRQKSSSKNTLNPSGKR